MREDRMRRTGLTVVACTLAAAGLAAPAQARETVVDTAPPGEKKTCKSYAEIGSLVKRRKVCRTEAQWQRVFQSGRRMGRDMVEAGSGRPSENQ